ncbi:hypothetical protein [Kineococcus sp. SYSU DK006]|uniref:hypothetical protein n=1 Tax=Kineococcus sp. SYSU DK006 TaxID=3383127 RepID=UPI003D7DCD8A
MAVLDPASRPHPPTGFAAAARLLHPATDEHQRPSTWAQVAARTGHPLHPASTWEQAAGTVRTRRTTREDWPGGPPVNGELGETDWDALLGHLSRYSGAGATCYLAVDDTRRG